MVRYAFYLLIFAFVIGGAYYAGYNAGANNTRVEYVTKEIEVIKYVETERGKIYSAPNISRDSALRMLHNGEL